MADAGPGGIHAHQHGVVVAIHAHFADAQRVPALLALAPQLSARAAEESDRARRARLRISLFVHEAQHQHFARFGILHDRGHQPVELRKIELHPASSSQKKNPLAFSAPAGE